jgi:(p)ppGpp synthase/HD superfamily hydrolase
MGFITRGRGLTVHLADCPNVHTYDEQRKVEVAWAVEKERAYPVKLKVAAEDRKGLLSDITSIMTSYKANILSAQAMTHPDRTAAGIYEIEIGHMSQLQKIIKAIQKLKGIRSVERVRGGS